MSDTPPPTRALPLPDQVTEPFWAAARQGRLVAPRSKFSGDFTWPPSAVGLDSNDDMVWTDLTGNGHVYTYSVVHRSSHPAPATPYVLAIVQLVEGIYMTTNIVDVDVSAVRIGMPVRVCFERLNDSIWLPVFRPAGGPNES